jgi:hypothetical protein
MLMFTRPDSTSSAPLTICQHVRFVNKYTFIDYGDVILAYHLTCNDVELTTLCRVHKDNVRGKPDHQIPDGV